MVTSTRTWPIHLIAGDFEHAVTAYAIRLSRALGCAGEGARSCEDVRTRLAELEPNQPVHLQFTDRLFGSSPVEAADLVEMIARVAPTTVTLHDVPQPSDGHAFESRVACYRRVLEVARGVVCNSRFEAGLVRGHTGLPLGMVPTVIPLPVDVEPSAVEPVAVEPADGDGVRLPEVAVLGYFYPGKGHEQVIAAVASLGVSLAVTALGRASTGHEAELDRTARSAADRGVRFQSTGFITHDRLIRRARAAAVPIAAHQHFSASASINTWIAAGRRPLVPDAPYTRELAELRPGTLTLYAPDAMASAIDHARRHAQTTWLTHDAVTAPDTADVADLYRLWWERLE